MVRAVLTVLAVLLTLGASGMALLVTGFLACGVSSCTGGGFGPVYSPVEAQVGLLVAGLVPLPLTLWLLRRQAVSTRVLAGAGAVVLGAGLAMAVLGLGPNGCPSGQSRATAGPEAVDPGSATCSRDPDALPRR
ncbi:hypothetical protein [Microlunatus flavus]|uniref:Uncharacterized protein n=1 Tax=Microlunatus flavus TaxID=1036181 RepID=A0A1H9C7P6_9ACTN|nr:hypothetical protein [Microlunatus flavus]SEP97182.1 hypothetical protein SAMN05421756_102103 [Microlunatus flavus]